MKTKMSLRYIPNKLTKKDKKKQANEIIKSRRLYKKGIYHTRPKVRSFQSKQSSHIRNAKKIYGVDTIGATNELAKVTGCSKTALAKIINKGEGAYYSSGSRPNQTAQSWGVARLASAITSGKSAAVDYDILKKGCKPTSKALTLAKKARDKHGHGTRKTAKTLIGGSSIILQTKQFNDIVNTIKSRCIDSNIEYEECGTIQRTSNGYIVNVHEVPFAETDRKHCNYEYYDNIIWHSHPSSSKFYPSVEDFLKSIKLKNSSIQYSLIFTLFGYWSLQTITHINITTDLQNKIRALTDKLYFNTTKGRVYNSLAVNNFMNEINTALQGILQVTFTPYII